MAKEEVVGTNEKKNRLTFLNMLFSDFGTDNSDSFVKSEMVLNKGGKPLHKYNMSSLATVRKNATILAKTLKAETDWATATVTMQKIPAFNFNQTGNYVVKKVVTVPYRPGNSNIMKWFGQILINPNKMYSEELWFAFIRVMTERGLHIVSFDKDTKGRLVSVTFDFTCIQYKGDWEASKQRTKRFSKKATQTQVDEGVLEENVIDDAPDAIETEAEDDADETATENEVIESVESDSDATVAETQVGDAGSAE